MLKLPCLNRTEDKPKISTVMLNLPCLKEQRINQKLARNANLPCLKTEDNLPCLQEQRINSSLSENRGITFS